VRDPVRLIADAVLYEGHVLWPYRRSALKNRERWTFGGVYPAAYAHSSADRWSVGFDCLLDGEDAGLELELRYLQVVRRQVLVGGEPVDGATVDGARYLSWDEASERATTAPVGAGCSVPLIDTAGRSLEAVSADVSLLRSWERLTGCLTAELAALGNGVRRLSVRIDNDSTWPGLERDEAMRRSFMSAHVVVRSPAGRLVSAVDPPERLKEASAGCRNEGLWPVLVGDEGDRSTLLAAPIILYDYPEIAPESPGDLFDGCEIDGLLTLSILALSDEEKREARASDPRAREILDRSEALPAEELLRLQTGAIRELRTLEGR
jgi:hypothetical protein